jgi:repressor LexA
MFLVARVFFDEVAARYDTCVLSVVRRVCSSPLLPDIARRIAHLPTGMGGLGLRSWKSTADAAFVAAYANAAEEHLQALARKGMIELVSGTSRGIRLNSETLRSIHEFRSKQFSLPLQSLAQLALPLIGRVAAGSPILAQEHVDQTYYVESSLFQRQPDYLLKVRGMSMRDAGIMDGDLLAVQATKEAKNGQIVVARLGEEVTVKRFRRNKQLIELHPENPDYQIIVVEPGDPFEIEGLAVGLIRNTMLM